MTATQAVPISVGLAKAFVRPLILGVVNCTPDSFHAPSRADASEAAVERALRLVEEGADILDLGGQSTRPGSDAVTLEVERARVIPAIRALAKRVKVPISIDTDKAAIAAEAHDSGATILNDISALRADKNMAKTAVRFDKVVLMHMLGTSPKTMQVDPHYNDVFSEVTAFLRDRIDVFLAAAGKLEQVYVDPGIGFGKTLEHNLELIRRVGEMSSIAPVLLGVSRKSMFAKISPDSGPQDRLAGSLAVASWAALSGVAVLRVHDVLETRRTVEALAAVAGSPRG